MIALQSGVGGARYVAGVDGCKSGWVTVLLELNGDGSVAGEICRMVRTGSSLAALTAWVALNRCASSRL